MRKWIRKILKSKPSSLSLIQFCMQLFRKNKDFKRVGPNEVWLKLDKWYHVVYTDSAIYINGEKV
jgi:hypothetical protein